MNGCSCVPVGWTRLPDPQKDSLAMSTTLTRPAAQADRAATAPRRRTRVLALPEARWALGALVLFLAALPLNLLGAPVWTWGPLFAAAYVTGGWEPGWAGLKALR